MSSVATTPIAALVGAAVLITLRDGSHNNHTAFAHVLAKGPVDDNGNPSLTVAFPDPHADPAILSSANWSRGYMRIVGVKHADHEDVLSGKESIAWGGPVATRAELAGDGPSLPTVEGDGSRPYLKRQVPAEVEEVSTGQAAAVQSGKAPQSSTQSPLIGESEQSQIDHPVQQTSPVDGGQAPADPGSGSQAVAATEPDAEIPGAQTGTAV